MDRKTKVRYQDRDVDATELSFQPSGEHWNEYLVEDGAVVKLKTVTSHIFRLDGEYDADGNPVYLVRSTSIIAVTAPEKLRRRKEQ